MATPSVGEGSTPSVPVLGGNAASVGEGMPPPCPCSVGMLPQWGRECPLLARARRECCLVCPLSARARRECLVCSLSARARRECCLVCPHQCPCSAGMLLSMPPPCPCSAGMWGRKLPSDYYVVAAR